MNRQTVSFLAAGLKVAVIVALLSPSCTIQHINWQDSLWQTAFPTALQFSAVPVQENGERTADLYLVEDQTETVGYIVEKQVTSRSGPFNILVMIDTSGRVKQALALNYPYERGRQVNSRRFTRQFVDKGPTDAIRIGDDINAISGATISSQVMTQGIREAVALVQKEFLNKSGI